MEKNVLELQYAWLACFRQVGKEPSVFFPILDIDGTWTTQN